MARAGCLAATLAGAVLVAIAAFAWFFVLADDAEPTSVDDAVTTFREQGAGTRSPVPEGVYVYVTDGFEKTDALTGVTHRYPPRSTITVTGHECGVRLRWDVLDGRSTTWTLCVDENGWTLASQDERHTFFGRTERTTYECSGVLFRPPGDVAGTVSEATCTTESADEQSTVRVLGRETLDVGADRVQAVHLRRSSRFTGETRGSSTHDVWLDRTSGVLVRIRMESTTTNESLIGDVHYTEDVSLVLTSLKPRR